MAREKYVVYLSFLAFDYDVHAIDMYVMRIHNGIDELNKCIVWVKTDYTDH